MTLLLSMPRRRVDPAVLGVTLAYPSPFYCSVVWNQLVFRSFLVRNTNLPTFTAVCLSELFLLTVGAVQQKRINKCRYLDVPFVPKSTPNEVNVLQDVVQLVQCEPASCQEDDTGALPAHEPCPTDSLRHSWVNKWSPKPGDIRFSWLDIIILFATARQPPRQHLQQSLCPRSPRNVLNR